MEILFIRHAESELNVQNITHKTNDTIGLTEKGRIQAQQVASVCKDHNITLLYTSSAFRTIQTADIISKILGIKPVVTDRLVERNLGDWLGKPWNEIKVILEQMDIQKRYSFIPPLGESWYQEEQRVMEVISEITAQEQQTAVVTHEGVLRALMPVLTKKPLESSFLYEFQNGSVTIFEYSENGFLEKSINDTAHLHYIQGSCLL